MGERGGALKGSGSRDASNDRCVAGVLAVGVTAISESTDGECPPLGALRRGGEGANFSTGPPLTLPLVCTLRAGLYELEVAALTGVPLSVPRPAGAPGGPPGKGELLPGGDIDTARSRGKLPASERRFLMRGVMGPRSSAAFSGSGGMTWRGV